MIAPARRNQISSSIARRSNEKGGKISSFHVLRRTDNRVSWYSSEPQSSRASIEQNELDQEDLKDRHNELVKRIAALNRVSKNAI